MSSRRQKSVPLGGRYRQVSLYCPQVRMFVPFPQNQAWKIWTKKTSTNHNNTQQINNQHNSSDELYIVRQHICNSHEQSLEKLKIEKLKFNFINYPSNNFTSIANSLSLIEHKPMSWIVDYLFPFFLKESEFLDVDRIISVILFRHKISTLCNCVVNAAWLIIHCENNYVYHKWLKMYHMHSRVERGISRISLIQFSPFRYNPIFPNHQYTGVLLNITIILIHMSVV